MSRLAPRAALAEKERDCCSAVGDVKGDDDKDVRNVEVEVVVRSGCCWLLEMRGRAEEKGRVVGVVVAAQGIVWKRLVEGIVVSMLYVSSCCIVYSEMDDVCTYGLVDRRPVPGDDDAYDLKAALHGRPTMLIQSISTIQD